MSMDTNEVLASYRSFSELQQAKFLSRLGHQITIFARDTYNTGTEELSNPRQLRCINELMHKILSQQSKILLGNRNRYPDDIFIKMIFNIAATCGFDNYLLAGANDSMKLCLDKKPSSI